MVRCIPGSKRGGGILTTLTVTTTTTTNINLHKIKIKFILLELLQKPGLSFLPNYFLPSNYLFETPLKNQSFNYLHFWPRIEQIIKLSPLTQHKTISFYFASNTIPFDKASNHPLLPSIEPSVPPKGMKVFGPDHHATEVIGRVFRENGLLEWIIVCLWNYID